MERSKSARGTVLKPELFMPVEVEGSLHLDGPHGQALDVVADAGQLHLEQAEWSALGSLIPRKWTTCLRVARNLEKGLRALGLTLHVYVDGQPVLRVGHDVAGSWLARLAGLDGTRFTPSLLLYLLRR
jgi:hypothetical protein